MDQGIADANRGEYLSAISHFQEAQWHTPGEAAPYYNLALAEAQIPGRELRAICWFGAYLTASPATPHKAAIVDAVAGLQARSRQNIAGLVRLYEEGAKSPAFMELRNHQTYKDHRLYTAGMLSLHLNDPANAEKIRAQISWSSDRNERLGRHIDSLRQFTREPKRRMVDAALNDDSEFPSFFRSATRSPGFYLDSESGYWVGYTHVPGWKRLGYWISSALGRTAAPDWDRLETWADTCNGFALAQPAFTDLSGNLADISYAAGPHDDWRALDKLMDGVAVTAGEMTYVHNASVHDFAQLLDQTTPSWRLLSVSAIFALLYGVCILWVASMPLLMRANTDARVNLEEASAAARFGTLIFGIGLNAGIVYLFISTLDDVDPGGIIGLVIGGAFLACLVVASFTPLMLFVGQTFVALRRRSHAPTQFAIGSMYEEGREVAQDDAAAMHWYRRAADRGSAAAQYRLGQFYRKGKGVARDDAEALKWFRAAAANGNAAAQNNLGLLYATGQGVARDYAEAMKWFTKAADQDLAEALENIGLLFEHGNGVARDVDAARTWYRRAADLGSVVAGERLERLR